MPESWRECEGQLVDGQFPLVRHIGGSDHSVVFLTQRGKGTLEEAAIKFVPAEAATADTQLSRWKSAAQLSHPNLIKLYESGRCHLAGIDLLYVVMEHASENLAQFLPHRALSPAETRDMLEPFVETLSYLHGKGFVHGGIRPGNILAIDDQLKLSSDAIRRVGEGRIGKAPVDAYAPPEAALGQSSEAGDIWALGVTLIEALTQRVPESASATASDAQQLSVPESLPQPFLDIAHHSLQSKPQQRWTIADISQKLNPKAASPPPPALSVSQSIPAAAKPAAPPAKSAPKDAAPPPVPPSPAPRKSAASVDPLSVPLSTVALDRQVIAAKKSPGGGYYLLVAVVLALTIGVILAIPRFRSAQSDPGASIAPSQPTVQPATSPTKSFPEAPAKAQPKIEQKQSAPRSNQPQRSALEPTPDPKQNVTQGSKQAAQETADAKQSQQPPQKERALSPAASTASLKSAVPRSDSPSEAAPFVADREASIKSGVVTPGEALNQVLPDISQKSRSTIHGTVRTVVKVHVDADGSVSAAEVASGPSKFFSTAALDAAKRWDFAPAKIDGHAVPSEWLLHFDFSPTDTKVTPLPTKP